MSQVIQQHQTFENIRQYNNEMVKLFDTTKQNVSLHLKNVFQDNELLANSVSKEFLTTASDSKKYQINV